MMLDLIGFQVRIWAAGYFNRVGLLADLAELRTLPKEQSPAVYLLPLAEDADEPRRAAGAMDQAVLCAVGAVLVVNTQLAGAERQAVTADRLREARLALRRQLFGWRPPEAEAALAFGGGELLAASTPHELRWQDVYTTTMRWRV
jgi:hypothetical protein